MGHIAFNITRDVGGLLNSSAHFPERLLTNGSFASLCGGNFSRRSFSWRLFRYRRID
jgi:hypothetical protein